MEEIMLHNLPGYWLSWLWLLLLCSALLLVVPPNLKVGNLVLERVILNVYI